MAMKRGKPEPLLGEVTLCARMGWTLTELRSQPARFVELLGTYLGAMDEAQSRDKRHFEEELESRLRRLRL